MEEPIILDSENRNDTGAAAFFSEIVDHVAPIPAHIKCPCCDKEIDVAVDWMLTEKHFEQLRATANIMWMYFDLLLTEAGITQDERDRLMHEAMARTMGDFSAAIEAQKGEQQNE